MGFFASAASRSMGTLRAPRNHPATAAIHASEPSTASRVPRKRMVLPGMGLADHGLRAFDAARGLEGLGVFSHDGAGDDEALDLARSLVDLRDPGVPVVPLDGMVLHVPPPAEDLHGLVGDLVGDLRGVELRTSAGLGVAFPTVLHPRGLVDEEAGRPYSRLHVGQLERYGLVLGDGLPEGGALRGVARGVAEGGLGDANGLGCYPDPPSIQRAERYAKTFAFHAKQVLLGDEHVVEEHVIGGRGDHAHLPRVRPEGDAFRPEINDEGRDPLVVSALRAGEEDRGAGDAPVGYPLLVPGDAVATFDPLGPRRYRRGVGARLRLGQA